MSQSLEQREINESELSIIFDFKEARPAALKQVIIPYTGHFGDQK